jgi:hypothetical protein
MLGSVLHAAVAHLISVLNAGKGMGGKGMKKLRNSFANHSLANLCRSTASWCMASSPRTPRRDPSLHSQNTP